jgi:hypothetical protein
MRVEIKEFENILYITYVHIIKLNKSNYFILLVLLIITILFLYPLYSEGQLIEDNNKNNETTFHSQFNTYVVSDPSGYGSYQPLESFVFKPNQTLILYIEPANFGYKDFIHKNYTQHLMNFSADILISDENYKLISKRENIHIDELISFHKNKEVFLTIKLELPSSFPEGRYIMQYFINDEISHKNFEINKNVVILK